MIVAETEKETSHCNGFDLIENMESMLIEALQVGYEVTKEVGKTPLLNMAGEIIVDIIQQGLIISLLMRVTEYLAECDRFMDALTRQVSRWQ